MTLQILNVEGAGVIKVIYRSDKSFWDSPLKKPKAPKPLITSVLISRINPIQDFVRRFIAFTSSLNLSNYIPRLMGIIVLNAIKLKNFFHLSADIFYK